MSQSKKWDYLAAFLDSNKEDDYVKLALLHIPIRCIYNICIIINLYYVSCQVRIEVYEKVTVVEKSGGNDNDSDDDNDKEPNGGTTKTQRITCKTLKQYEWWRTFTTMGENKQIREIKNKRKAMVKKKQRARKQLTQWLEDDNG